MFVDVNMPKGSLNCELLPYRTKDGSDIEPTCRACKQKIRFVKTPRGKTMPVSKNASENWEAHFIACPNAEKRI